MKIDDVVAIVAELPDVTDGERHGRRTWFVAGKAFAWERAFSKADIKRFGDDQPPDGPILAVMVADLEDKEAVLAEHTRGVFTIPHFNGFKAVLIQLKTVPKRAARELIVDAWIAVAPPKLVDDYMASRRATRRR